MKLILRRHELAKYKETNDNDLRCTQWWDLQKLSVIRQFSLRDYGLPPQWKWYLACTGIFSA